MRLFSKKSADAPGTADESTPSAVGSDDVSASDSPLRGDVRFQVDAVYNITGIGCVATGKLLLGAIRPKDTVRIEPGPGSPTHPAQATVRTIMARHHELPVLEPGTEAGLSLGAIGQRSRRLRHIDWDLQKGDFLVYP